MGILKNKLSFAEGLFDSDLLPQVILYGVRFWAEQARTAWRTRRLQGRTKLNYYMLRLCKQTHYNICLLLFRCCGHYYMFFALWKKSTLSVYRKMSTCFSVCVVQNNTFRRYFSMSVVQKNTFSKGKTLNILVLLHILIYQTLNFFNW